MKMIFDLDLDKCVACGACAVACMDQNDIYPEKGDKPFRTVGNAEPFSADEKIKFMSLSCMHCDDAPCIEACPCNVLAKNEIGFTIYNNENCIGCHSCLLACPYGAPTFGTSGKMEKCNGCEERVLAGYEPACVRICPTKALTLRTEEEYVRSEGENTIKRSVGKVGH